MKVHFEGMWMDNEIDITGFSPATAMAVLLPYMAQPADVDKRERLYAYLWAKIAVESEIDFPQRMLSRLVEAAQVGVGTQFSDAAPGGCMAGDVLLVLLEMAKNKIPDAGLDKAQHVVSTEYQASVDEKGKEFRAGRDTVNDKWKQYRNVAHLWAAYLLMVREAEVKGIRDDRSKLLDGCKIAALANGLQHLSAQYVLPRNNGQILPDTALRIIGAADVSLTTPELSTAYCEVIKSFEPRIR